ncbi:MAG: mechanosensitive ion channel [Fibrobacter sp.]|nr:mechanosensitive ion channel [Fibrobacter sp.]
MFYNLLKPFELGLELDSAIIVMILIIIAIGIKYLLAAVAIPIISKLVRKTPTDWDDILFEQKFFDRASFVVAILAFLAMLRTWVNDFSTTFDFSFALGRLTLTLFILLTVLSLIKTMQIIAKKRFPTSPLLIIFQVLNIIAISIGVIVSLSIVAGKSPGIIVSGFGALAAVLMLVFKDPIMGLVAGIQLSSNKMLAVGDWLEMPKYNADGDVIEISLTTVNVLNWDKTITTIPTSALINDSFKNWQGMFDTGGRRIKRSVFIEAASVKFLDENDIAKLTELRLIKDYMHDKIEDVEKHNQELGLSPEQAINGRQLTNLGTFRAYLTHYINNHPEIHRELISMVRQLQSTPEGIPMEIYCFTADTRWVEHERVQADVFDHIFAIAPAFGLQIFQNPSANNMRISLNSDK